MATKFEGRFYLIDNCLTNLKCWVYEFEPMTDGKRSSEEWAEAHLQENYDSKAVRELFRLPVEGDFQVLFTAEIDGKMSYGVDGDDYNEWLDIDKVAYQRVPIECAAYFTARYDKELSNAKDTAETQPQGPEGSVQRDPASKVASVQVASPEAQAIIDRLRANKANPGKVEPNDTDPIEHSSDFQARVDQAQSDYLAEKRRIANEPD